ncbi:MAG: T9SS type A sorting domain-containing protein [Bacteroidetes bacterium]|nr:T9SS type A sorting domain-containing protein [Bacteroidota bacterium]
MKKIYTVALCALSSVAFAQKPLITSGSNVTRQAERTHDLTLPSPARTAGSSQFSSKSLGKKAFATKIGETMNDQQTNASIYRRLILHSDGKLSATWTTSADAAPYATRGSGFNSFDGTTWGPVSNTRIEPERCGFPSIEYSPNTNEVIVMSHIVKAGTGNAGGLRFNRKTGTTGGTWNSSVVLDTIESLPGVLWPRTAVSGDNLYVFASYTDSSANQPGRVVMDGIRTPQVFSHYKFSTNTWVAKNILLPGYEKDRVYSGGGDNYSIDAKGDNVAVLIGGLTDDLALWKSTDAGLTWTKTIIDSFPVGAYDYKTLVDTTYTNDGGVNVVLDNNGKAHCFWGKARVLDANIDDNSITYYPGQNAILYWQEGWDVSEATEIAGMPDENNNGDLDLASAWNDAGARYGNHSIATMPYATVSSNGVIYLIFSALTEDDISADSKNYRDVYMVHSKDGGNTWSGILNCTSFLGFNQEQIFASLAKDVDGYVHMTFLQKSSIGRYDATNNPGAVGPYDVVYMKIDTASIHNGSITSLNKFNNELFTVGQNYPNPLNDFTTIPVNFKQNSDVVVRVMDLNGKEVMVKEFTNTPAGASQLELNLSNLNTGVYLYSVEAEGFKTTRRLMVN